MQLLMDQEHIAQTLATLAERLLADAELHASAGNPLALVGIRSRGELLAQRLAAEMMRQSGKRVSAGGGDGGGGGIDVGALDITMYRDDFSSRGGITIPRGTDMNFRLDGRAVILVDDVLQTGRSVRAALDALVDFGRPRIIRLAVLIDRGNREYPIAADYVGLPVKAPDRDQKIVVHLRPTDAEDAVYLT
jgi:pyrimidine operon attenuation protein/uracil phosphoribosyltransferase